MIATIDEDDQELIIDPASHEVGRPKSVLHGLRNHAQNGITGRPAVVGSKVLQSVDLNCDHAEWKPVARKTGEILGQMKLGEIMIGNAADFVHTTVRRQGAEIAVPFRGKFAFIKTFHKTNDRVMRIPDGRNQHSYVHGMALFMAQLHLRILRLALLQSMANGTGSVASNTTLVVTVNQDVVAATAADDLMPFMASNPFRALVPEKDFPGSIHHTNASLEDVQDRAKNLWILKFRHRSYETPLEYSSAESGKHFRLQTAEGSSVRRSFGLYVRSEAPRTRAGFNCFRPHVPAATDHN